MSYSDRHYGAGDPNCPICGGIGYLRYDVPEDHPLFGKIADCNCRQNQVEDGRQAYLRRLGGLQHLTDKTFGTFLPEGVGLSDKDKINLKSAFDHASKYAMNPQGWLLITGSNGCGKTHLAAAVANHQIDEGHRVFFITVSDLLDHLRGAYGSSDSEDNYESRFEEVRNIPLLILDDLGTESPSAWAQEKLFQILNYRYTAQLPTVVTTNRNIEEFEPRIRSRFADPDVVHAIAISAPDYRAYGPTPTTSDLAGLGLYQNMTFDNFKRRSDLEKGKDQNLAKAVAIAREFAENPDGWLVLMGTYGSGKTHLAAAIANYQAGQGTPVLFVTIPDLMDHLRAAFAPNSTIKYDKRFNEVRSVQLLILDDLTLDSASPWAREKLHQILNYRYFAELPTVITTAHTGDELKTIDPRLAARIGDKRMVRAWLLTVPSYRGDKEKQPSLF